MQQECQTLCSNDVYIAGLTFKISIPWLCQQDKVTEQCQVLVILLTFHV